MLQELINYVQQNLSTNNLASAGVITAGAATVGASIWSMAKSYPNRFYSYLMRRCSFSATIEHNDKLYQYINEYLSDKYPNKFRRVEVESSVHYVDTSTYPASKISENDSKLTLSHENDYVIFWNKYRRITATKTKEKLEAAHDTSDMFRKSYTFYGLFARKSILSLLHEIREIGIANEERRKQEKKVISYHNHSSYGTWDKKIPIEGKTFDSIFLQQKDEIISDLDDFLSKKELYTKYKVPFKRGYAFFGAPGNGKSATVLAIANYLKYDIYSLNVTAVYAENFRSCIDKIPSNSILLIEDIDGYYNKRKSINQNKIPFSQFINVLSGIDNKENILTIFTTNHFDKLDPALIRDGRCDKKIRFTNPSRLVVQDYLKYMLNKPLNLSRTYKANKCFAEIQNIVLGNIDKPGIILQKLEE